MFLPVYSSAEPSTRLAKRYYTSYSDNPAATVVAVVLVVLGLTFLVCICSMFARRGRRRQQTRSQFQPGIEGVSSSRAQRDWYNNLSPMQANTAEPKQSQQMPPSTSTEQPQAPPPTYQPAGPSATPTVTETGRSSWFGTYKHSSTPIIR